VNSRPSDLNANVFVVLPEGRLDALAAPDLENTLAALEAQDLRQIVIDFSQASYISSSPLRVVLVHARKLRQAGGDLKLCCLSDKVAKVLCCTGLDAVFDILPTKELAVQAFPAPQKGADSQGKGP